MTFLDLKSSTNTSQLLYGSKLDRRYFTRVKLEGVTLIKADSAAQFVINGELSDVSASGLKITLDSQLLVGSEIKVSIFIKEEDLIFLVSGKILWCAASDKNPTKLCYDCGVEILYEGEGSDFHDWRALFIA
ncbi:MAG: PilZ domain-containing protein [Halothiobacillus sp.]